MIPTITIRAFDQPTCTKVQIGRLTLMYSYNTLVAFHHPDTGTVVHENIWSNTTNRTLNAIDGGSKRAKSERVTAEVFTEKLGAFVS